MQQTNQTILNEKENSVKATSPKTSPLAGSNLWGILIFFLLILIDQLTKAVADVVFIDANGRQTVYELVPGWVNLTITYNRGISFGIGAKSPMEAKIAVVVMTGVIMLALSVLYFKCDKRRTLMRLALVFIVAGGIGNLIDRVYYQVWDPATFNGNFRDGVRDMVDIHNLGFGVCNFADFFISAGAVMMGLAFIYFDSYAMKPLGKYKELAAEATAIEEQKQKEKEERKAAEKAEKQRKNEQTEGTDTE